MISIHSKMIYPDTGSQRTSPAGKIKCKRSLSILKQIHAMIHWFDINKKKINEKKDVYYIHKASADLDLRWAAPLICYLPIPIYKIKTTHRESKRNLLIVITTKKKI